MPLATCPRCQKLFNKTESQVCVNCQAAEDEDLEKVRQVIRDNPDMNAEDVASEAEVAVRVVNRMLDEGMIERVSSSDLEQIKCGRCGAPAISASKKLCERCLAALNKEMAQAQANIKLGMRKKTQIGMYSGIQEDKRQDKK